MKFNIILFQGKGSELRRLCKDIRENMVDDILLADFNK